MPIKSHRDSTARRRRSFPLPASSAALNLPMHSSNFSSSPIVVLDSGLGGLTVAKAIRRALPAEELVYFGDTARLPYGTKSPATVTTFVRQIIDYLRPFHPKHVVIACNTATAVALPHLRSEFPGLSISGVIEPGAKAAVEAAGAKAKPIIGVIATEATIKSKAYDRAILRRRHHAGVLLKPTPLLVPMIEEGRGNDDPVAQLAVKQYLEPMAQRGVDVLVLGCTHYPILKKLIGKVMGSKVAVIDSGEQCAQDVARRLRLKQLLRPVAGALGSSGGSSAGAAPVQGKLKCFVTDDPARFGRLASRFLGFEIAPPTWVPPDDLYGQIHDVPMRVPA